MCQKGKEKHGGSISPSGDTVFLLADSVSIYYNTFAVYVQQISIL